MKLEGLSASQLDEIANAFIMAASDPREPDVGDACVRWIVQNVGTEAGDDVLSFMLIAITKSIMGRELFASATMRTLTRMIAAQAECGMAEAMKRAHDLLVDAMREVSKERGWVEGLATPPGMMQ